uniref:Tctex1 domain-containing protein 2 n=1 Tax=Phallusia mammillata TaxID=59560 RepID=A0A6F9DVH2_9ASCI|nr:tctex1 domain-containing protein 2 [Phallusia mammillata]
MDSIPRRRFSVDAIALANAKSSQHSKFGNNNLLSLDQKVQKRRNSMAVVSQSQNRRPSYAWSRKHSRFTPIKSTDNFEGFTTTFTNLPAVPEPKEKMENTYKLNPDNGTEFRTHIIRKAINEIFDDMLPNIDDYFKSLLEAQQIFGKLFGPKSEANVSVGGKLAKLLVTEVKDKLKTLGMDRYKFVTNAFVGDCVGQRMMIVSKSLFNTETDGHVTVQRQTAKYYAVVVVHALYFE